MDHAFSKGQLVLQLSTDHLLKVNASGKRTSLVSNVLDQGMRVVRNDDLVPAPEAAVRDEVDRLSGTLSRYEKELQESRKGPVLDDSSIAFLEDIVQWISELVHELEKRLKK